MRDLVALIRYSEVQSEHAT